MKTRIIALFGIAAIILHLCGCHNESVPESAADSSVDHTYYAQWPDAATALSSATDTTMFGESLLSICSNQKILKRIFKERCLKNGRFHFLQISPCNAFAVIAAIMSMFFA